MRALKIILLFAIAIPLALLFLASSYDAPPTIQTFYDRRGEAIGSIDPSHKGLQLWTPLSEIPQALIRKTLSIEDRFFFWHPGINPFAILKAGWENLKSGKIVRGGSTITQQLAKILIEEKKGHLSKRTFSQKLRETLLALGLELRHPKSWILERYLNSAYYGRRCYGLRAASQMYFGKDLTLLSKEEDADFLVSLPKAPNRTSPLAPLPNLTPEKVGEEVKVVARHYLDSLSDTETSLHAVQTTLDLTLQRKLEKSVQNLFADRIQFDPKISTAVVVINVKTGDLLSLIGSRDYFDEESHGQVNGATAPRQPGSALKPFTYLLAFSKGFSPDTLVPDEPVTFASKGVEDQIAYSPQNFDRRFHGTIPIRQALANSYNVPAVVTLNEIGLSDYAELLHRAGFTTIRRPPPYYGLSLTLGSAEVTLLELTNAYAALARGGFFLPIRLFQDDPAGVPRPLTPQASRDAAEITAILSDPEARRKAFGLNTNLEIEGQTVAVKTGTSYNHRDNWTIGYTPSYAVGVWVGHPDGSPLEPSDTGASLAAPLWHAVMQSLLQRKMKDEEKLPRWGVSGRRIGILPPILAEHPALPVRGEWSVLTPRPHTTFRVLPYLPKEYQKIPVRVRFSDEKPERLTVSLDGRWIGETSSEREPVWMDAEPGRHRLRIVSAEGEREEIPFKILEESQ